MTVDGVVSLDCYDTSGSGGCTCGFSHCAHHSCLPFPLHSEGGVPRHQEMAPGGGYEGCHQPYQVIVHVACRSNRPVSQ